MVSATEASQMCHVGLGHLGVFSMNEVFREGDGVERCGDERCRAGTPNDGSAGRAVQSDGWLVFLLSQVWFLRRLIHCLELELTPEDWSESVTPPPCSKKVTEGNAAITEA